MDPTVSTAPAPPPDSQTAGDPNPKPVPVARLSWTQLALEVFSVVLAVLLALGVNEWRQAQANEALAEQALVSIRDELVRNQRLVREMLPEHEAVARAVGPMNSEAAASASDTLFFLPIILRSTAWQTATQTQAMLHMDYEVAAAVAEIYTFQDAYAGLTENMMASAFDVATYDPDERTAQLEVLRFIAAIFTANERELLAAYERTLAVLDEALDEAG